MTTEPADTPAIVCDMTGAPDTGIERLAEYSRLFGAAFVARERTEGGGIRWVLRADPGIQAWAADLAARENACCAFMTNTVTVVGEHVHWDATVIDDDAARAVLHLLFELPDRRWDSPEAVYQAWDTLGVPLVVQDGDLTRPATVEEPLTGRQNRPAPAGGAPGGHGDTDAAPAMAAANRESEPSDQTTVADS